MDNTNSEYALTPLNLSLLTANVPQSLQEARQWIPWRAELCPTGAKKIPVNPNGQSISAVDPRNWLRFEDACSIVDRKGMSGIGLALPSRALIGYDLAFPLVAFDVDWKRCPNGEPEIIPARFQELVARFHTYSEFSPSRKGLRMLVSGKLPTDRGTCTHKWSDGTEVTLMQHSSYVTVTGMQLPHSEGIVQARQSELEELFSEWWSAADARSAAVQQDGVLREQSRFVIHPEAEVSPDDVALLVNGWNRSPEQRARMLATWEKRRQPDAANAEFVMRDHSVSSYVSAIVREVLFVAPRFGWSHPEQRAADFAVAFARKHGIPIKKITAARIAADISNQREYASQCRARGHQAVHISAKNHPTHTFLPSPPPPTPGEGALCNHLGDCPQTALHCIEPKVVTSADRPLFGNISGAVESVTRKAPRTGRTKAVVLDVLDGHRGWIGVDRIAAAFGPRARSRKAILMALGRLVSAGVVQRSRNHQYRLVRPGAPRSRKLKPFPVCLDGTERKTICRTELVRRGWSRALIDSLFAVKGKDYSEQQLLKPYSTSSYYIARYYDVARVRQVEAESWFELRRYALREQRRPTARGSVSVGESNSGRSPDHGRTEIEQGKDS
jgi:hypothetical protein